MALFVRRRWPLVAAAAALAAASAVAVTLYATRDRRTADDAHPRVIESAQPLPADTGPAPLPIAAIYTEPARFPDRPVAATSVRLLGVVSPSAVWVGEADNRKVLVVIVSVTRSFADVQAGAKLTFTGEVRPTTPEFARAIGMQKADEALFIRQAAYVEVSDFTVG